MARSRKDYGFSAIRVEGGILPPEYLQTISALAAKRQDNADYGLTKSLNVKDEIGRYWRMAMDLWNDYKERRSRADLDQNKVAVDEWLRPLFENVLCYHDIGPVAPSIIDGRRFPIGYIACAGAVPLVLTRPEFDLDRAESRFGDEGRRRPPYALLQEYLNAEDTCLWGIIANGNLVRLARDNPSLTRPAFIEADLERMFDEQLFADFAAFWLTFHVSRLAPQDDNPAACILETWRTESIQTGERAREKLREGVTVALRHFGNGFLEHPANETLRKALSEGELSDIALFQELLRLVYRLLFLLTVEDRDLLFYPDAPKEARRLFNDGYSVSRLRDRALKRRHYDQYADLWQGLQVLFGALAGGASLLGLPALGGLFRSDQCPHLDGGSISNERLLQAIRALTYFESGKTLARVNYRDMGTEELGSVYESLLELHPTITGSPWGFGFISDDQEDTAKGSERRVTGSYYTRPVLVNELIKSALIPIIERTLKANQEQPRDALLALNIVDPACGSGHFLLAAARQLASEVARLDSGPDTPGEQLRQHALRDVVQRCIYGVDRNPLAVELCKTALWIETVEPGKPLTFLDAHIRCGDSLIGVLDLSVLKSGIPNEAYKHIVGDEKDAAAYYHRKNSTEMKERVQRDPRQAAFELNTKSGDLARALEALEAMPEESVTDIDVKRHTFESLQRSGLGRRLKVASDLWCAAFFAPKAETPQRGRELIATSGQIWQYLDEGVAYEPLLAEVELVAWQRRFFHWPLEFPEVFAKGGFDLVLGNPPWKPMSPDHKEFFSTYDPQVRFMSPPDQKAAFERLLGHASIATRWDQYCRNLYTAVHFMKSSGRYRLFASGNLGKGDFNVYRMFVETAFQATREGGTAAQFVPEGFYKGANASAIRAAAFRDFNIKLLVGLLNTNGIWFPSVHQQFEFCLYVAIKGGHTSELFAAFRVNSHEKLVDVMSGRGLRIPIFLVREFSPEALAVMEFAAQEEIDICTKMYRLYPKFGERIKGQPHRIYMREVDMGNDRDLFSEGPDGLPVFEGRMIDTYDYRAKGYKSGRGRSAVWEDLPFDTPAKRIQPQWRITSKNIPDKLSSRIDRYRIGFCDVVNPGTEKCLLATIIPPQSVCGHSVPTILLENASAQDLLLWIGIANSLAMDFIVRKKVRLHMTYTVLDTLPFPRDFARTPRAAEIVRRVCALCAVGPEMANLRDQSVNAGILSSPRDVVEEPHHRAEIAAEIDVFVAREVYQLTKQEIVYILDPANILGEDCGIETFKVLRNRERREFGEYRTQRLILEAWDRLERGEPAAPSPAAQSMLTQSKALPTDPGA